MAPNLWFSITGCKTTKKLWRIHHRFHQPIWGKKINHRFHQPIEPASGTSWHCRLGRHKPRQLGQLELPSKLPLVTSQKLGVMSDACFMDDKRVNCDTSGVECSHIFHQFIISMDRECTIFNSEKIIIIHQARLPWNSQEVPLITKKWPPKVSSFLNKFHRCNTFFEQVEDEPKSRRNRQFVTCPQLNFLSEVCVCIFLNWHCFTKYVVIADPTWWFQHKYKSLPSFPSYEK